MKKSLGIALLLFPASALAQIHTPAAAPAPGPFSEAQMKRGEAVYAQRCATCHGAELQGASASPLAGAAATARWGTQTAQDLYARTRTMPFGAPNTLTTQEYLDSTAFVLAKNGHKPGKAELTADGAALQKLQIAANTPADAAAPQAPQAKARLTTITDVSAKIAGGPSQAELSAAGPKTTDWLFTNHDYAGTRYVDLKQITKGNVGKLKPVCLYQLGDLNPFPTNPLVYKGVMYLTSRDSTVSLDPTTCRVNWRYDRPSRVPASFGLKMNRGAALKDGTLFLGTHDGYLLALDAGTGALKWERDVAHAPGTGGGFTMAPLLYEDLLIIGPAGSEIGVKGWIGAFKQSTGELVWRFNTVPGDGEPGADTWPSKQARDQGGGAVWGSMTLDTTKGLLYFPVANPTPDWEDGSRLGDNLYTASMVVLDAKTGKYAWHHQITPHDTHDYDLTQASPQFSATIGGRPRNLIVTVGKEGILHTLDRDTREVLYKVPVTTQAHTDKPWVQIDQTKTGDKVCPGALGGVQWAGPAYNPGTKMLYVNTADWCAISKEPPTTSQGWVSAIDATTGEKKWGYRSQRSMLSSVLTTSAGLVFSGELSGDLLAFDAASGKELFRYNTGGAMTGGILSYEVGGKQYLAATSGGANNFWQVAPGSATVVIFALP